MAARRLGRLATSATRCLPLCNSVRLSGQGIKFVTTHSNATPPPRRNKLYTPFANPTPTNDSTGMAPFVSETNRESLSPCSQLWKANIIYTKPDIYYVYCRDKVVGSYFAAYSLEEDGTINTMSPKYYKCLPSVLVNDNYFIGASSNGLFLFHSMKLGYVLWNPTTSEYKILPKPHVELLPGHDTMLLHFGMWYDHKCDDYKVMHIARSHLLDEAELYGYSDVSYHIELYSLKTNSWKRIIPSKKLPTILDLSRACVSHVFYCGTSRGILSFDFSTETLSTFPFPFPKGKCLWGFDLLEYKGSLSALEYFYEKPVGIPNHLTHHPYKYHLWVMREGSWIRESVFHARRVQHPLFFSVDGKLLYFASLTDDIMVFDRATGKLKNHGGNAYSIYPKLIPFVESFVQLNGITHVEELNLIEDEDEDEDEDKTEAWGQGILAKHGDGESIT